MKAGLQIDAGNTRLKWRLLSTDGVATAGVLARGSLAWREFPSVQTLLSDLSGRLGAVSLAPVVLQSVSIVSVAGIEVDRALAEWVQAEFAVEAQFALVTPEASGIAVGYDEPQRLGVDRWLAVLAASRLGAHVLVVDCGSAVTVDILCQHQHLGGYIVPGLQLMNSALFRQTAQVQVADDWRTTGAPGRSTLEAVNSGIPLMVAGLVQEVFRRCQVNGLDEEWQIVLTGGDASLVASLLQDSLPGVLQRQVDDLVLDGLSLAHSSRLGER